MQFSWPLGSAPSVAILPSVQWPVTTDPLIEVEALREIRALEPHKTPGSDGLPVRCNEKVMELVRGLRVLSSMV